MELVRDGAAEPAAGVASTSATEEAELTMATPKVSGGASSTAVDTGSPQISAAEFKQIRGKPACCPAAPSASHATSC